ncbi:LiaI-LiaF-like domain-containing protein [Alloacidobacterium sp.]|uniref:LiaI-LiaF-like domain-containing protein n=1 Tax=Alloacidobacterium sp. TaxID=2951999 RepID=UPI002D5819DB|nr:DUF5668 domain-containing protein [Alloacidobacterium sp.]HYK34843.1 DUF5668 domain-containing protein [Alloacidobacterium sp.]
MNQYIFLQRIQGPAMLLTFGVCALLDQWDILNFGRSWPLYLIVLGVIKLAQRAALATAAPPPGYPQGYPGYGGYQPAAAPASPAATSTALVPTDSSIQTNDSGDGR